MEGRKPRGWLRQKLDWTSPRGWASASPRRLSPRMTLLSQAAWRHCNLCKVAIGFEAEYFICSVSTCNRKRTGLFFCSLACFEAHLPTARHRDAWAERQRSPSVAAARAEREAEETSAPKAEAGLPAAPGQRRLVA